jgi:hypothetical protein
VEGHRRYADEPEPSWYSGKSPYEEKPPYGSQPASPYDSGVHERPSGAFRLPEQRPGDPGYPPPSAYPAADLLTSTGGHTLGPPDSSGVRMPVRGPEYPAVRPGGATSLADAPTASSGPAAVAETTSVVPPVPDRPSFPGESVYRTRRPVAAILIAIVTVLLLVPTVMLLIRVTFIDDPAVRGIVPAVLLVLGLPLSGAGLYALAAGGPAGREVWLRPPVVYLPVGLVLLLAAGISVA